MAKSGGLPNKEMQSCGALALQGDYPARNYRYILQMLRQCNQGGEAI
jgi:hypothetical protein